MVLYVTMFWTYCLPREIRPRQSRDGVLFIRFLVSPGLCSAYSQHCWGPSEGLGASVASGKRGEAADPGSVAGWPCGHGPLAPLPPCSEEGSPLPGPVAPSGSLWSGHGRQGRRGDLGDRGGAGEE